MKAEPAPSDFQAIMQSDIALDLSQVSFAYMREASPYDSFVETLESDSVVIQGSSFKNHRQKSLKPVVSELNSQKTHPSEMYPTSLHRLVASNHSAKFPALGLEDRQKEITEQLSARLSDIQAQYMDTYQNALVKVQSAMHAASEQFTCELAQAHQNYIENLYALQRETLSHYPVSSLRTTPWEERKLDSIHLHWSTVPPNPDEAPRAVLIQRAMEHVAVQYDPPTVHPRTTFMHEDTPSKDVHRRDTSTPTPKCHGVQMFPCDSRRFSTISVVSEPQDEIEQARDKPTKSAIRCSLHKNDAFSTPRPKFFEKGKANTINLENDDERLDLDPSSPEIFASPDLLSSHLNAPERIFTQRCNVPHVHLNPILPILHSHLLPPERVDHSQEAPFIKSIKLWILSIFNTFTIFPRETCFDTITKRGEARERRLTPQIKLSQGTMHVNTLSGHRKKGSNPSGKVDLPRNKPLPELGKASALSTPTILSPISSREQACAASEPPYALFSVYDHWPAKVLEQECARNGLKKGSASAMIQRLVELRTRIHRKIISKSQQGRHIHEKQLSAAKNLSSTPETLPWYPLKKISSSRRFLFQATNELLCSMANKTDIRLDTIAFTLPQRILLMEAIDVHELQQAICRESKRQHIQLLAERISENLVDQKVRKNKLKALEKLSQCSSSFVRNWAKDNFLRIRQQPTGSRWRRP